MKVQLSPSVEVEVKSVKSPGLVWLWESGHPVMALNSYEAVRLADQIMAWEIEKMDFDISIGSSEHDKTVKEEYAND